MVTLVWNSVALMGFCGTIVTMKTSSAFDCCQRNNGLVDVVITIFIHARGYFLLQHFLDYLTKKFEAEISYFQGTISRTWMTL